MTARTTRLAVDHAAVTAALVVLALAVGGLRGDAHKAITSPYTFNRDVLPIVRARCASCHRPEGSAPMSLLTHADAVPWAESIRAELLAGHMPPWHVDGDPRRFRNAATMTARELNVLLTWASGGTPPGEPAAAADQPGDRPADRSDEEWALGPPDIVVPMPAPYTVDASATEATATVTLDPHVTTPRWIRAVDVRPGNRALVRDAVVTIGAIETSAGGRIRAENVVSLWVAGDTPIDGAATAVALPAGAQLTLRIHYRKPWDREHDAMSDRSVVGVYFASAPPAAPLQAVTLEATTANTSTSETFTVTEDLRAVAIYPDLATFGHQLEVTAAVPGGAPEPLITFTPQPHWARRYWYVQPIALPRGTRIEARVRENGAEGPRSDRARITIDVVPVHGR